MKKFDEELYLVDMYEDGYFPNFLVDKIKTLLQGIVTYLENGKHSLEDIQSKFDEMTENINVLNEEFYENESELETVARESIGETVDYILQHFRLNIDVEEAIRNRDW